MATAATWRNCGWVLLAILGLTGPAADRAAAQSMGSGLIPPNLARRYGLERVWYTQIEVGRGRGRVQHVTPHVNTSQTITTFEIKQGTIVRRVTEKDRSPFGEMIGPEGARAKADEVNQLLKKQNPTLPEPVVEQHIVPAVTLYAATDRSAVHAIDGETGLTRWVSNFGNPAFPTTAVAACDKYVAYANGSTLYVLRASDGALEWQRTTSGVPGSAPAVSDRYVFAPMVNGALESYTLDDYKETPWIYRSIGRSITAPLVGTDALAWPTDRGHLYVASSEGRAIRYRLETKNHFVATPAFLPPDRIVVCSTDGYVYCLHSLRQSGNIMWKYSSGEPISKSPVVIDGVVYVVTDDGKLFALSSDLGQLQWKTPGVRKILSVTKNRIYAVGDVGFMRILDKASGALISSVPLTEFDLQVTNTLSDRLYFGTQTGVIQCLREIGTDWPLFHGAAGEATKAVKSKPKVIQRGAGGAPGAKPDEDPFSTKKPEPGEDPFGGGGAAKPQMDKGDDPFGGGGAAGGAAPKPAAPKGKPDDDPFG